MTEAISQVLAIFGMIVVGLFIWAAFSPFETLGWWAGWFGDKIYDDRVPSDGLVRTVPPDVKSYVIFLSGVGRVSGYTLSYREQDFLRRLAIARPDAVIIDDIFPYSVNNLALTGQPFFGKMWRWALRRKIDGPALAGLLINVRNIFQVWMSADHRYGPLYNQATAEVLLHGMLRYDYPADGKTPVFVIGYSGAGQMAVGAMTYLREWIEGPLYVISLGGVFGSDPGLLAADHVFHIEGSTDRTLMLSYIAPGRWPLFATSEYNRAKRQGRISVTNAGPMVHTGRGGYLDAKTKLPDGTPRVDRTVDLVSNVIEQAVNNPGSISQTGGKSQTGEKSPAASLSSEVGENASATT